VIEVDRGVVVGNAYDKYGTKNPLARLLMAGFLRAFDRALPARAPATVLEVGAGEGRLLERVRARFPAARCLAAELSPVLAARAARQVGLPYVAQSAEALGIRDHSVDLVIACEVLEHLSDPARALAELARVAKGSVVLSVPREPIWRALNLARGAYVRDFGNTPGHRQHWSTRGFVALVSRELRVVRIETPLPWTVVAAQARSPS
jgi:ubiquinone/menaquinone biosynthesis C-methylase UbiE